ncbi:MAG: hypothetical protein PHE18_06765 [Candidatus Omnitrophica bacterium]|nr:hypothetical protein [Candidatus Omnitrophota bacterium]MDD5553561.1 hypothetical protein [Candidatus Omnitrophota bacterium]
MGKYSLEFILNTRSASAQALRNSIVEFGETLEVIELRKDEISGSKELMVRICAEDPAIIFDTCAQFGKLKSIKINEEGHP